MADNITEKTIQTIQTLVHDAFDTNAILDRVKTVLTTTLAFPIFGGQVHMLAHKYSLDIGDGVGDLIEAYNEPVNYGDIPKHIEDYSDVASAIDKIYDVVITYQNELNQAAKIAFDNMDIHVYQGLLEIIGKHNKYAEQVILWKDIYERYKDSPSLDVHMEHYDILGD